MLCTTIKMNCVRFSNNHRLYRLSSGIIVDLDWKPTFERLNKSRVVLKMTCQKEYDSKSYFSDKHLIIHELLSHRKLSVKYCVFNRSECPEIAIVQQPYINKQTSWNRPLGLWGPGQLNKLIYQQKNQASNLFYNNCNYRTLFRNRAQRLTIPISFPLPLSTEPPWVINKFLMELETSY